MIFIPIFIKRGVNQNYYNTFNVKYSAPIKEVKTVILNIEKYFGFDFIK